MKESIILPATLRPNLGRILAVLPGLLISAVVGAGLFYVGLGGTNWTLLAVGAFFCIIAVGVLLNIWCRLTLTEEHFEFKGIFKNVNCRWEDVESFLPMSKVAIGWNYVPERKKLTVMRKLNRGMGTEASIPGQFGGMSSVELAAFMNKLRIARQTAPPLSPERAFGLAVSAILTELNGQRHDCLLGDMPGYSLKAQMNKVLSSYWDVSNSQAIYETLQWLSEKGHRTEYEAMHEAMSKSNCISEPLQLLDKKVVEKMSAGERKGFERKVACVAKYGGQHPSILAWDLCRLVSVARFGAGAEYLTEAEAWKWIDDAALRLKAAFSSWRELSENYLVGREFWGDPAAREQVEIIQKMLLDKDNSMSPWNRILWDAR